MRQADRTLVTMGLALALTGMGAPAGADADEAPVTIGDNFFEPKTITVDIGTTVVWTNRGDLAHSVTADDGSFDSSPACPPREACMQPGETYSRTFPTPGTFRYYCRLHGTPGGGGQAGKVVAVDPATRPTTVDSLTASLSGAAVTATGRATFGGQPPVLIAEDPSGDGPLLPAASSETGVDLTAAKIYQPNPKQPVVVFEWHVTRLPASGTAPEAIRYLFPFAIGTVGYQLQAKLTNLATTTLPEDPQGHVSHIGRAFQVRGRCGPGPGGITTCAHLGWVDGEFDVAKNVVRAKVPMGAVVPELKPGAVLTRLVVANATIVASYQAVVSLNPTTSDEAVWEEDGVTYTVPTRRVMLGIAAAGTDPASVDFATATTLADDGSFSGSVDASGLAPGAYDLWARACFGANCGLLKATVTI